MEHESLDPIETPMGRVRAVLSEYYEHRRRLRSFLPLLPPLPEILRERSARLHCRFAYATTGCTAGVIEAAGGILAVATIAMAITVGAIFAHSTPESNTIFVGTRGVHSATAPVVLSGNGSSDKSSGKSLAGPFETSFATEISTSDLAADAPVGVKGKTEIKRGITLGLSREWIIRVGDYDVPIAKGTLLWINCESNVAAQRAACDAYDDAPPEVKERRDPPDVNSPGNP